MAKDCECTGRPCYECSTAGGKPVVNDSFFADTLGYD